MGGHKEAMDSSKARIGKNEVVHVPPKASLGCIEASNREHVYQKGRYDKPPGEQQ